MEFQIYFLLMLSSTDIYIEQTFTNTLLKWMLYEGDEVRIYSDSQIDKTCILCVYSPQATP